MENIWPGRRHTFTLCQEGRKNANLDTGWFAGVCQAEEVSVWWFLFVCEAEGKIYLRFWEKKYDKI